jgi:hypothetical protein
VRAFLAEHPGWSRYRLSRQLATLWDRRNSVGQLKDMAARTLLLKLAQRGVRGPYTYEPCDDVDPTPDCENVLTD